MLKVTGIVWLVLIRLKRQWLVFDHAAPSGLVGHFLGKDEMLGNDGDGDV
jgi:hypothetical protein